MTAQVTTAHRVLLGLSAVLLGAVGILFLAAPGVMVDRLAAVADPGGLYATFRVAAAGVLGEVAAILLAMRSRSADVVRLVSLMLIVHFSIETVARIGSYVGGESSNLFTALPQALLAVGLAVALARARSRSISALTTPVDVSS